MGKLHIDFETYADIPVDDWRYFSHPSFAVTVVAWAFGSGTVHSAVWPWSMKLPYDIRAHILAGGTISAHNASFEYEVLTKYYRVPVSFSQLDCTMARSYHFGLPGGLLVAGTALKLAELKDESARSLMLEMSKPPKKGSPFHEVNPGKLDRLAAYCKQDVRAERALDEALPVLPAFERKVSVLTDLMNEKGILIDPKAIIGMIVAREHEKAKLNAEASALTSGVITNPGTQHLRIVPWLAARGVAAPKVGKKEVEELLASRELPDECRKLLELRKKAAKGSLAKLEKMIETREADNRCRGQFQYHGALRTGRWAGRGFQPQNLPRPVKGLDTLRAFDLVMAAPTDFGMLYADPLRVLTTCLRPCIVAPEGKILMAMDLSQIEARVVAWLAGQADVLEMFAAGEDVYTNVGRRIGGDRGLGKVAQLMLGYAAGAAKFVGMCADNGISISLADAERYVAAWRAENRMIQTFWWDLQAAVYKCVSQPGVVEVVRGTKVKVSPDGALLKLRKPNGGVLYYHRPRLVPDPLNPRSPNFMCDGDPGNPGWPEQKLYGGRLVENLVQATARDVLAEAMVRIWGALGLVPTMTVHDEAVYEVDAAGGDVGRVEALFNETPKWAAGLPLGSDTKCGVRYGK